MNSYERIYNLLLEGENIDWKLERPEFERYGDPDKEVAAAKKGRRVRVRKKHTKGFWKGKTNTEAGETKSGFGGLKQAVKTLKSKDSHSGEHAHRIRRAYDQVKSGTDDPSVVRDNELVAGNTRAMMRQALGKKPKVHRYKSKSVKGSPTR